MTSSDCFNPLFDIVGKEERSGIDLEKPKVKSFNKNSKKLHLIPSPKFEDLRKLDIKAPTPSPSIPISNIQVSTYSHIREKMGMEPLKSQFCDSNCDNICDNYQHLNSKCQYRNKTKSHIPPFHDAGIDWVNSNEEKIKSRFEDAKIKPHVEYVDNWDRAIHKIHESYQRYLRETGQTDIPQLPPAPETYTPRADDAIIKKLRKKKFKKGEVIWTSSVHRINLNP